MAKQPAPVESPTASAKSAAPSAAGASPESTNASIPIAAGDVAMHVSQDGEHRVTRIGKLRETPRLMGKGYLTLEVHLEVQEGPRGKVVSDARPGAAWAFHALAADFLKLA